MIAAFALVFGNPKRLIHGYDDFGNICGSENEKIGSLMHSGLDMRSRPYLFYFDMKNIKMSSRICVSKCPNRTLNNMKDLKDFYKETNSSLCRYNFNVEAEPYGFQSSSVVDCPVFPVYKR